MTIGECRVLVVVVTFNPGSAFASSLASLRASGPVLVVDNRSDDQTAVARVARELGCELLLNPRNIGLAAAYNQALERASRVGAGWLALFDQDSSPQPDLVPTLMHALDSHPQKTRIAIIAPTRVDTGTARDYQNRWSILSQDGRFRTVRATISSGSIVDCAVARQMGGFAESLFIDGVDHDISLKVRRTGMLVVEYLDATMQHSIGRSTPRLLLGRRITVTNTIVARRYYMSRNYLEIARRHAAYDPEFCLRLVNQICAELVKVVLFEDQKRAKIMAHLRGVADFARRRFGPGTPPPA